MSTPRDVPLEGPKAGYTEGSVMLQTQSGATERHLTAFAPKNSVQWAQEALTGRPVYRPNARMPIEAHAEARRFLIAAEHLTCCRLDICCHITSVRCHLYVWALHEHANAESTLKDGMEKFGWTLQSDYVTETERIALSAGVANVKTLLGRHYPDCEPLCSMVNKLNAAAAALQVGTPQPRPGNRLRRPRSSWSW